VLDATAFAAVPRPEAADPRVQHLKPGRVKRVVQGEYEAHWCTFEEFKGSIADIKQTAAKMARSIDRSRQKTQKIPPTTGRDPPDPRPGCTSNY